MNGTRALPIIFAVAGVALLGVAPSSRAIFSFSSERSTAMTREAPQATAPSKAESPTPPRPTTATPIATGLAAVLSLGAWIVYPQLTGAAPAFPHPVEGCVRACRVLGMRSPALPSSGCVPDGRTG